MNAIARRLAAVDTSQDQKFPESARQLAAEKFGHQRRGRLEVQHNLRVSRADLPHLEKVYSK